uniref:Legume lectin domain-containing protein n=1 Tax=Aegilops tauschii TaxID=37682 RepID=N1R384_AEGTA
MLLRRLAAVILLLLFSRDVAGAQEFVYDGFAAGKVATTDAAVVTPSGILQLTNDTKETLGHGFYPAPLRFRDANTGAPVSFSTTFVLAIAPRYPDAHGHGIAFALAPSVNVPGAVAGKQVVQMLEHAVPPPEMSPEVISESMKQFEHHEAFDEFVGMSFPSTSEVTTATTQQFSNGSRPRSDFHSS